MVSIARQALPFDFCMVLTSTCTCTERFSPRCGATVVFGWYAGMSLYLFMPRSRHLAENQQSKQELQLCGRRRRYLVDRPRNITRKRNPKRRSKGLDFIQHLMPLIVPKQKWRSVRLYSYDGTTWTDWPSPPRAEFNGRSIRNDASTRKENISRGNGIAEAVCPQIPKFVAKKTTHARALATQASDALSSHKPNARYNLATKPNAFCGTHFYLFQQLNYLSPLSPVSQPAN